MFGRWEEAVGAAIAANVRPVRLEDGTLLVEVDDPAWATQVRFLADDLRSRLGTSPGSRSSGWRCGSAGRGAGDGSPEGRDGGGVHQLG